MTDLIESGAMRTWLVLSIVMLSAGCSPDEPIADSDRLDGDAWLDGGGDGSDGPALPFDDGRRFLSGTRLRVRWREAGGASQFAGWRDTGSGLDCRFLRDENGEYRCLPGREQLGALFAD